MVNVNDRKARFANAGRKILQNGEEKINLPFDLSTLQLMCRYVITSNQRVKRTHLINLRNLFDSVDISGLINDNEKLKRFNFIKLALEARINIGLDDQDAILSYIKGGLNSNNENNMVQLGNPLSNSELDWVTSQIENNGKLSILYNNLGNVADYYVQLKSQTYVSPDMFVENLMGDLETLLNKCRNFKIDGQSENTFSLKDGYFEDSVRDIHKELCSASAGVTTGIQGINELVGGRFENGRCYLFLGASGMGKSLTLLSLAYQIKKYNKGYKTKDPTKIPCVVLLTMENSVKETVERLFNIATVGDNIRNFTADEVIEKLRTDGGLTLNDASPVDIIIKYKPNGSIDTSYLYTLMEELENDGYECITLVQDYVRRIRSAIFRNSEPRIELGEIINEFKNFAAKYDIPVLTAGQLNREAAKSMEAGATNNKADLIRSLGRSNVGESLLMIDNSDVTLILDNEFDKEGIKYLGLSRVKERYKIDFPYKVLFIPFEKNNKAKLVEDIYDPIPAYKETLKEGNKLASIGISGGNANSTVSDVERYITERREMRNDDNIFETDNKNGFNKYRIEEDEDISEFDQIVNSYANINIPIAEKVEPPVQTKQPIIIFKRIDENGNEIAW